MKNSIRNLIIGSAMFGIGAALLTSKKDTSKKQLKEKSNKDFIVTNFEETRKYHKIAEVYQDEENNIQLKKVI